MANICLSSPSNFFVRIMLNTQTKIINVARLPLSAFLSRPIRENKWTLLKLYHIQVLYSCKGGENYDNLISKQHKRKKKFNFPVVVVLLIFFPVSACLIHQKHCHTGSLCRRVTYTTYSKTNISFSKYKQRIKKESVSL